MVKPMLLVVLTALALVACAQPASTASIQGATGDVQASSRRITVKMTPVPAPPAPVRHIRVIIRDGAPHDPPNEPVPARLPGPYADPPGPPAAPAGAGPVAGR